eukprot:78376-Chlamydomonas_euryale.AAC.2
MGYEAECRKKSSGLVAARQGCVGGQEGSAVPYLRSWHGCCCGGIVAVAHDPSCLLEDGARQSPAACSSTPQPSTNHTNEDAVHWGDGRPSNATRPVAAHLFSPPRREHARARMYPNNNRMCGTSADRKPPASRLVCKRTDRRTTPAPLLALSNSNHGCPFPSHCAAFPVSRRGFLWSASLRKRRPTTPAPVTAAT